MPATVILSVVAGDDLGKRLTFSEPSSCIVGRDAKCNLVIRESDSQGRYISRRHFRLNVHPPTVVVRDLGSRSGTYIRRIIAGKLQETLIGKRASPSPANAALEGVGEQVLRDGDEIRAHHTVFRVSVTMACDTCGAAIDARSSALVSSATPGLCCEKCQQVAGSQRDHSQFPATLTFHESCGSESREHFFDTPTTDPFEIARALVEEAAGGDSELVAIEGYQIIKELGRGGAGCVCLAENLRTGEHVALKVLRPDRGVTKRMIDLFRDEADQTKVLRHDNVVTLFDYGCSRGTLFFTSEFCEAGSVDKLIQKSGSPLARDLALDITFQALDGLDYAHHAEVPNVRLADGSTVTAHGIVHRDIKPGNIFLKRIGRKLIAKVGDYGLAKAFDFAGMTGRTSSGTVGGTPSFMPRQQARHFRYVQRDADVWAMAASLYCMLTGSPPRQIPPTITDVVRAVSELPPIPIRKRNPKIPKKLAEVIDYALDDSEQLHFATAKDFRNALIEVA